MIAVEELARCLDELDLEVVCHHFYGRPMHRIVVLGPKNDWDVLIDEMSLIQVADAHDHNEVFDDLPRGSDLDTIVGFIAHHFGVDLARPTRG